MTKKTYAYIYCRVSTSKQKDFGSSLESQAECCLNKAKEYSYDIAGIYREDVSGTLPLNKRREMLRMVNDIRKFRKLDKHSKVVVLIYDPSRFARDTTIHIQILDLIECELKARVQFIINDFDGTPTGKFLRHMHSGLAQMEKDVNADRVIQKMAACAERGNYVYGRAKIGYEYASIDGASGKIQKPHSVNAPIISEAMSLFAVGSLTSQKEVKEYLEANGIVYEEGKRKGGVRKLHLSTVRTFLRNAWFYAGFIPDMTTNGSSMTLGKHKPIITVETYEAIEVRLGIRTQAYHKANQDEYPLKGWIRCGHCGYHLTSNGQGSRGKNGKSYLYYQCHHKGCSHYKKGIPPSMLHVEFEKHLSRYRCPDELYTQCKDEVLKLWKKRIGEHKMQLTTYKTQLRDVEHKLGQATHTLIAVTEPFVRESVTKVMGELSTEKSKLEAIISQKLDNDYDIELLVDRLGWLLTEPEVLWRAASLKDKRTIQNLLVPNECCYTSWGGFRKLGKPLESAEKEAYEQEKGGLAVPKRFELLAS